MSTRPSPRAPRTPAARTPLLRTALFVGSVALAASVFLFSHFTIRRLTQEVRTTSRVLAQLCAQASFPVARDSVLVGIFQQVIAGIDFPIVITDTEGLPRAWRQVGVESDLVPDASLDSVSLGVPVAPVIAARIAQVRSQIPRLDRANAPIVMTTAAGDSLGMLHYGHPPTLDTLRWMPVLSVIGTLLLLSLGLWGLAGIRAAEKRTIWVGMARETAHQLGTPLSSMMGWIELLRSRAETVPDGADVPVPRAELDETLSEMERDVERLNKVAMRFSHVGSTPVLHLEDVTPVVRGAVEYMRRRVPGGEGQVVIRERYEEVPPVNHNRELLEWALENLLSNAVSALDRTPGVIEVVVERRKENEAVEVRVTDNGRGMSPAEQKRAFEPGYTTKRRGWGLGLALARRVVEEYHGGRIRIRHSAPGQGTTMVISFPV